MHAHTHAHTHTHTHAHTHAHTHIRTHTDTHTHTVTPHTPPSHAERYTQATIQRNRQIDMHSHRQRETRARAYTCTRAQARTHTHTPSSTPHPPTHPTPTPTHPHPHLTHTHPPTHPHTHTDPAVIHLARNMVSRLWHLSEQPSGSVSQVTITIIPVCSREYPLSCLSCFREDCRSRMSETRFMLPSVLYRLAMPSLRLQFL